MHTREESGARRRRWLATLLVLGLLCDGSRIVAAKSLDEVSVHDVGDEGVCLYGNWFSGEVTLSRMGCRVYIEGIRISPGLMSGGVPRSNPDCSDLDTEAAYRNFRSYRNVLSRGSLLVFLPGVSYIFPHENREHVEAIIREARDRATTINAENWPHNDIIVWGAAELLRTPMRIEDVKEF